MSRLLFSVLLGAVLCALPSWPQAVPAEDRYAWVSERLDAPAPDLGPSPVLVLADAADRPVATSAECVRVSQGEEHWVCGRIRVQQTGTFVLKAQSPDGVHAVVLQPRFVLKPDTFDVVLVLDGSHSMRENDPADLRLRAAEQFWRLSRASRRIRSLSVIVFRDTVEVLVPPTSPASITRLDRVLRRLRPRGSTDFNEPLATAAALLARTAAERGVVMFLSDGQPKRRYRDTHRALAADGSPVYTIGLSADADAALLGRIAQETGGLYFDAPSAEQLHGIFTRIFRIIESPRTVMHQVVGVTGAAELPLQLDETMHNTIVMLAPLSGTVECRLDGALLSSGQSGLGFHPLPSGGSATHVLQFKGRGRTACDLVADTDLALEAVGLSAAAAAGTPLQLFAFLRQGERVRDARLTCIVHDPQGDTHRVTPDRTPFGLFRMGHEHTTVPGRYSVSVELRARLTSGPVYRQTIVSFVRHADSAPRTGAATRVLPVVRPDVGAAPDAAFATAPVAATEPTATGLAATLWASADSVDFGDVYPGREAVREIEVLAQCAPHTTPELHLRGDARAGVAVEVRGRVSRDRRSTIPITVRAASDSAGSVFSRTLAVVLGVREWQFPIRGRVACPTIKADLSGVTARVDGDRTAVTGTLTLRLSPDGVCPLSVAADRAELEIANASVTVRQEPVEVAVRAVLETPSSRRTWRTVLHVTGPGLAPVSVPLTCEYGSDRPPEETASVPVLPAPVPGPARPWWQGLSPKWLLLLLLLLVLLLAACLRLSPRTAFLIVSVLVHAAILCMVLPESELQQHPGGAPVTVMTVSNPPPVVEESIAAETAAESSAEGTPAEAAAEREEAAAEPAAQDEAREVAPSEAPAAAAETEASEPVEDLAREDLEPEELPSESTQELARKHAESAPQAEQSQASASRKAQVELDAVPEAEAVPLATETPEAAAAAAETEASERVEDLVREDLAPAELPTESTQELARKHEEPAPRAEQSQASASRKAHVTLGASPEVGARALTADRPETRADPATATADVAVEVARERAAPAALASTAPRVSAQKHEDTTASGQAHAATSTPAHGTAAPTGRDAPSATGLQTGATPVPHEASADPSAASLPRATARPQTTDVAGIAVQASQAPGKRRAAGAASESGGSAPVAPTGGAPVSSAVASTADVGRAVRVAGQTSVTVGTVTGATGSARSSGTALTPSVPRASAAMQAPSGFAGQPGKRAMKAATGSAMSSGAAPVAATSSGRAGMGTQAASGVATAAPGAPTGSRAVGEAAAVGAEAASPARPSIHGLAVAEAPSRSKSSSRGAKRSASGRDGAAPRPGAGRAASPIRGSASGDAPARAALAAAAQTGGGGTMADGTGTSGVGGPAAVDRPLSAPGSLSASSGARRPGRKSAGGVGSGAASAVARGSATGLVGTTAPSGQGTTGKRSVAPAGVDSTAFVDDAASGTGPVSASAPVGAVRGTLGDLVAAGSDGGRGPSRRRQGPAGSSRADAPSASSALELASPALPEPVLSASRELPVSAAEIAADAPASAADAAASLAWGDPNQNRGRSRWPRTFPNLQHSGDWDCDRTAMLNLAHQFEMRTGSILPFDSRNVKLDAPEIRQAPFLFMSGHTDFHFTAGEVSNLREYLQAGGYLWINDSTDVGDDAFDAAVRRELRRIMPRGRFARIPEGHALFRGPYDLTRGYKGYMVPPGDKYRQNYLEGIWLKGRLTVIYTRNDYGDGLEIDERTAPLVVSLTDLSPREMQESSIRMGTNIAMYCINDGALSDVRFANRPGDTRAPLSVVRRRQLARLPAQPVSLSADVAQWQMPEGWQGSHFLEPTVSVTLEARDGITLEFEEGTHAFQSWRSQAVVGRPLTFAVARDSVVLVDVTSHLPGGGRVALGFTGVGPVGYIETEAAFIRPGENPNVAFDFGRNTFKTAQTGWQYQASWPAGFQPDTVLLIAYPQEGAGRVDFGNMRAARKRGE